MYRSILAMLFLVCFSLPCFALDDPVPLQSNELKGAIEKGIPLLQKGAAGSSEQRQCFTCHSQALPIFALQSAASKGFHVDKKLLEHEVEHTYQHLKRGLDAYQEGKGQGGQVLTAGYALWALDEVDRSPDTVTDAVAKYLLQFQKGDPTWHHHSGRPPSSDSDFTATYVALRGLNYFGSKEDKIEMADRKSTVAKWLIKTIPKDTEDHVFRLGSLAYVDVEPSSRESATKELLALQRTDGGWSQNQELESDAYATGSATSILLRHGGLSPRDPAIVRAASYLVRSQLPDGSWHVKTRAKGFQTYFESGFPHEKDQFISIAASSWATLALTLCYDDASQSLNDTNPKHFKHTSPIATSAAQDLRLSRFDQLIEEFLLKHNVPGLSIAVSNQGSPILTRAYGYADVAGKELVTPASRFRIASLSKPITAVAVLQLIERKQLSLDEPVAKILALDNDPLTKQFDVDPRFFKATIQQLLQHTGGWDRDASFDPMFSSRRLAKHLNQSSPLSHRDTIRAMLAEKMDFEPGEKFAYSNFGYSLLGRVIEKISGQSYEEYVVANVLHPLGIITMKLGKTRAEERAIDEVRYYDPDLSPSLFPIDSDVKVANPYGAWSLEAMDSHGGWIATAQDLLRLATPFQDPDHCKILSKETIETMFAAPPSKQEGSASPKGETYYSMGWNNRILANGKINHWHTGSLPGTTAILILRHDGKSMVALLNSRYSSEGQGKNSTLAKDLDSLLHRAVDSIKEWPTVE